VAVGVYLECDVFPFFKQTQQYPVWDEVRIPVKWATDSGDVGQGRSEATLVVFLQ
jgi:hypothetical protein